jgi:hypothetical protein
VTIPFRPTVAPSGIGIVFQTRIILPIAILKFVLMLYQFSEKDYITVNKKEK